MRSLPRLRAGLPAAVLVLTLGAGLLFAGENQPGPAAPCPATPAPPSPAPGAPVPGDCAPASQPPVVAPTTPACPAGVEVDEHGEPRGLHRHIRWSKRLGQGAQPEGDVAFRNLAALGYTTIVSVDGAVPDVASAARFGLTYVHAPIGYDGVPRAAALHMIRAVQLSKGPVYFHCHHGKHRGPAACAMPALALEGLTPEEAVARLERSKTSHDYAGLYRDVKAFVPPTQAELDAISAEDLPSVVRPEGVQAAMVSTDERFARLKTAQEHAFGGIPGHPDVAPAHEALMLEESFREIARLPEAAGFGEVFLAYNTDSEAAAKRLGEAIKAKDQAAADEAMTVLTNLCTECHRDFRN